MKSNLFVCGDSFTFGHNGDDYFPPYRQWREYFGSDTLPPEWHAILGKKLNRNVINCAAMGASNDEILHQFINILDNLQKGDTVIINWTFLERYRWARTIGEDHQNPFCRMGSAFFESDNIDISTHQKILYNNSAPIWKTDIYNYIKIIDKLSDTMNFDIYYWDTDGHILYQLDDFYTNPKYIGNSIIKEIEPRDDDKNSDANPFFVRLFAMGGVTIEEETNGYVHDPTHLGERGHELIAEIFYEHIKKNHYEDIGEW